MKTILRILLLAAASLLAAAAASAADMTHVERDYEIALTKGQYEIEQGNFEAAAGYLEQALRLRPGDQEARVSLGIAQGRAGNDSAARVTLQQAVDADPADGRARYELALVLARLGQRDDARQMMERAVALSKDDELLPVAQGFLREPGGAGKGDRPSLRLDAGIQYDSNVILEQDDPQSPAPENRADWKGVLLVDGRYPFLTSEQGGGAVGYRFYQSLHQHLEDYNVQQHAATAGGHLRFGETVRFDVTYAFLYSFVGAEHYSTSHRFTPRLTAAFTERSATELHGSYEAKRFFDSDTFTNLTEKNGTNAAAGLTHSFQITGQTALSLDYTYDRDDAEQAYWDYTGHRASLNLLVDAGPYRLFAGASYHDRRYGEFLPGRTVKRHDGQQEATVGVSRKAGARMTISLSDTYTFNDSNLPEYEYRRNIAGLFVEIAL